MTDSNRGGGRSGGSLIGGCFLFVMGLCLLLAGGSCAFASVTSLFVGEFGAGNIIGFLIGLLIPGLFIAAGIILVRIGLRNIG